MKTQVLTDIGEAANLLLEGEPIAIPTETVYGLAAPVFFPDAIRKIFQLKGRPQDNPLIVHVSSMEQAESVATEIPYGFYLLAEAFFPGPLTIILKKKNEVPAAVSAGLPTIGVRMPGHPLALKLIDELKMPLAAPSANLSGKPSSTSAHHVLEDFEGRIRGILDGGICQYGIESTVLLLEPKPVILRPGAISQKQIETVIGRRVEMATQDEKRPLCPGMKYKHYSPKAKVLLFDSEEALKEHAEKKPTVKRKILQGIKQDLLYALFREADRENMAEIAVVLTPSILSNSALMNRLVRASS